MEKKFAVKRLKGSSETYATYEEAEKVAKQYTANNREEYAIYTAIAKTATPVPNIEVVKL